MQIDISGKSIGQKPVLGRIKLTLAEGEVLALTGPSGIGKTTLARLIAGLEPAKDSNISETGRIGMVFQEPTLLAWRNVIDNICIATGCDAAAARKALDNVELGDRCDAFPLQLSLGQQRRVALARALAARPDTLILDEAFASLDEATAARMRDLTRRILEGAGFRTLLITHNLDDAAELADRVLLLGGSPAQILTEHRVNEPRKALDRSAEIETIRAKQRAASDGKAEQNKPEMTGSQ